MTDKMAATHGAYTKLSAEMKAQLGKYAVENGVAATLRKYAKSYKFHHY